MYLNRIVGSLPFFALIACGDMATSVGDLGHIEYSLNTRYILPDGELRDLTLVVGHAQSFNLDLTEQGAKRVDDTEAIRHRITPSQRASVVHDGFPSVDLLVTDPGTYTLSSRADDRLIDRIDLTFARPDDLSIHTWVKEPGDDDFVSEGDQNRLRVSEGSQISLLPIPLMGGERLTGNVNVEVSSDPPGAVVPAAHVWSVTEQNVAWSQSSTDLFIVGSGSVTLTIEDLPNGLSVIRTLDVEAAKGL